MPTPSPQNTPRTSRHWLQASLMAAVAAVVAACKSAPDATPPEGTHNADAIGQSAGPSASPKPSSASNARAYRSDAAHHLYHVNAQRIFKGKLPPALYAIGVLEVDLDRNGRITRLHWMRAPHHAPEVVAEIERTVRAAAPFPAPARLDRVTYTDTWLWDQSGHFQLDTLSEGQL